MMDEHQEACAEDVVWSPDPHASQQLQGSGLVGLPISDEEAQRRQLEYLCVNAVRVLEEARKIRADAALMVEVRAYIHKLRDDGAALLDDLG